MPRRHLALWFAIVVLLAPKLAFADKSDPPKGEADLRDGDIIFQTTTSSQSAAIQLATKSPYSHVGIIFVDRGVPVVYEAIGRVVITPLKKWIKRGVKHRYVVKRLKNAATLLTPEALGKMKLTALTFLGKKYDLAFEWSDDRIYCSELVWKIYDRALGLKVGQLQKLKDFDLSHPKVKAKLKERYGKAIPMDETVISPSAVFDSDLLEKVLER